jgi:hypothetical protein
MRPNITLKLSGGPVKPLAGLEEGAGTDPVCARAVPGQPAV